MDATWIVSANAGRASIFSQMQDGAPLEEINDMVNTAVRLHGADLGSDEVGQLSASKSRHGAGAPTQPSAYEPDQSPAEHQTELFARSIAGLLLKAHQEGRFRQLCLVASPEFLGVLRKQLDPALQSLVRVEINKDYTQFSREKLREQIIAHEGKG